MSEISHEAERYILSCIIQFYDGLEVKKAVNEITEQDFKDPVNREIFKAVTELKNSDTVIDLITIGHKLGDNYLSTLTDLSCFAITSANISHYVRILKEERQRERIIFRFNKALEGEDLIAGLNKIIDDEKGKVISTDYYDTCQSALTEAVMKMCKPLDTASRIPTGFLKLDQALGKFEKGTVSLIGAYPSGGKTAFAINIINHNLKYTGNKCAFFSLEMSTAQIYERIAADRCDIDYGKIRDHLLNDDEKNKASLLYSNIIKQKKLVIIDDIYYAEQICRAISDIKPDYVVIDFIHCVRAVKRLESRRSEIDYISQCFKECAKKNNCHIIILCQLSRPEKGTKRPPRMSDLKESGGLEQDGDYIIMIHRPHVLDKTSDPTETHILLDKNKYGDTGQMKFRFLGRVQRFTELIQQG